MYRLCSNTQCSHADVRFNVGGQICPHCRYETDIEFEPGDTLKIDPTREARVLGKLSHSKDAGMSAVYLVQRKRSSGAEVRGVLKVAKAKSVHALEREVTHLQRLQHYHIVRLLYNGDGHNPHTAIWSDIKDGQKLEFVALEYMNDGSLKQKIQQQGALDLPEALAVVKAIGQALDHLHLNDTVHLDIKPANILFSTDGRIVLSDFGVARSREDAASLARRNVRTGTLVYNAPEQLSFSTSADHRVDIYALGIVLYEMLIGRNPVQFSTTSAGTSTQGRRIQQALEALPKPSQINPKIPPGVEAVILKATHPDLYQRYNSGAEMAKALEQVVAIVQRQRSVRLGVALAAAVLVLLAALVGVGIAMSGRVMSVTPTAVAIQPASDTGVNVTFEDANGVILGDRQVTPTSQTSVTQLDPAPTVTLRPGQVAQPTSTLAAYVTPTPANVPTSAPAVIAATATTATTSNSPGASGPRQLIFPENKQVFPAGTQRIEFQWRWGSDCSLPDNLGFELRIWKDGAAPMGAMDAAKQQNDITCSGGAYSFTVGDLPSAPGVKGQSGRFNWDVQLVNIDPYTPLSQENAQTYIFELGAAGGSDGGGGSGGGGSGAGGISN